MFEWYATGTDTFRHRTPPNLLWATLTGVAPGRVRHPLYYLVLERAIEGGAGVEVAA